MKDRKRTFQARGYEETESMVKPWHGKKGGSGYIGVPKAWVGRKVRLVLLEPPDATAIRVVRPSP